MEHREEGTGPRTNEEKHYQPDWLSAVRAHNYEVTKDMSPQERRRYYQEKASWISAEQRRNTSDPYITEPVHDTAPHNHRFRVLYGEKEPERYREYA